MENKGNVNKYPVLRTDLKIAKQMNSGIERYVIKDPIKDQYYRFEKEEWEIISLFDGFKTKEEMVHHYNHTHRFSEIDVETIDDYFNSLNEMNLLQKSQKEHNTMLVEKMKEMRKSQLLSKKGSILYKRFPFVDPDDYFNKVIDNVRFFWTKKFLFFSLFIMILALMVVIFRWHDFVTGTSEVFAFSKMSIWNLIFLWVTIYTVIAIHEIGHGLTCKHFGGEVHEIGFLMLFFQPCLYCNVNDAWLFEKKHQQVLVTIAGGYIEFFIGALFCILWGITNPNTLINVLSFQVMMVCSVSTVFFNFNPLIKLDGYYLLADYLEIPNLRDNSSTYIKYVVSKHVFRMEEPPFEGTRREKRIYFIYGLLSSIWIFFLLTGIYFLVRDLLIDRYYLTGLLISFAIAYFLFLGQVKSAGKFLLKWVMAKKELLLENKTKKRFSYVSVLLFLIGFIPFHFSVPGSCILEPSFISIIRPQSDGILKAFHKSNGEVVKDGDIVFELENPILKINRKIAELKVEKMLTKHRSAVYNRDQSITGVEKELEAETENFRIKEKIENSLKMVYKPDIDTRSTGILECEEAANKLNSFVKEGDEVCKVLGVKWLKAVIEIEERHIALIKEKDPVSFLLSYSPLKSYQGIVHRIRAQESKNDRNIRIKSYFAEILIHNPDELRPGMTGIAKILPERMSFYSYAFMRIAQFFRADIIM